MIPELAWLAKFLPELRAMRESASHAYVKSRKDVERLEELIAALERVCDSTTSATTFEGKDEA